MYRKRSTGACGEFMHCIFIYDDLTPIKHGWLTRRRWYLSQVPPGRLNNHNAPQCAPKFAKFWYQCTFIVRRELDLALIARVVLKNCELIWTQRWERAANATLVVSLTRWLADWITSPYLLTTYDVLTSESTAKQIRAIPKKLRDWCKKMSFLKRHVRYHRIKLQ